MDLVNETPFPARLLRMSGSDDLLMGTIVTRPHFAVEGRALVPTDEGVWPVGPDRVETPCGTFPGDVPYLLGGIDVFVIGSAHQPEGRADTSLRMEVRIGEKFRRQVDVLGDRRWVRDGGGLAMSEPEPFTAMPLTWDRAFGGTVPIDGGEFSFPDNVHGRGIVLTAEQAEGVPLPNLEDPEHRIASFEDHPEPIGTAPYPADGGLRARNAVDLDLEGEPHEQGVVRIKPLLFNQAAPRMIIPPAEGPSPGDEILVSHASPEGPLRFQMPDFALHAHVQLGERSHLFPLHLDQIGILTEERRVFLGFRVAFRYRLVRLERRRVTLHAGPAPASVPDGYVTDWSEEEDG